jgi:hypothetical protein
LRKTKLVRIEAEGRDRGKCFLLVEKDAFETEKWATRALLALGRAGVEGVEEAIGVGALGLLAVGVDAMKKMHYEDAEPLFAEMLTCVSFVPDAAKADQVTSRPLSRAILRGDEFNEGDIEEAKTIAYLRDEVLDLHLGFSLAGAMSMLTALAQTSKPSLTPMSPNPAVPSSRGAKQRSRNSKASMA